MAHSSDTGGAGPTDRGPSGQGPESQNAGGRDNDLSDRNKRGRRDRLGQLPPEFADLLLADGRRLGDVLGPGFFGEREGRGRRSRRGGFSGLGERGAALSRLGFTKSILTSPQGVSGTGNIAKTILGG